MDVQELPDWVFGYGSLMWNPGFEFEEQQQARLIGLHRAPCIYSWKHRGTPERPGIVLGLDRGGACVGSAFRLRRDDKLQVVAYLRERELVTNVYLETHRQITLANAQKVTALVYVADRTHDQYAGKLTHNELVTHIKGAVGNSGPNEPYIIDTAKQLQKMGIRDSLMENLARELTGE